jgi:hypothetical protein
MKYLTICKSFILVILLTIIKISHSQISDQNCWSIYLQGLPQHPIYGINFINKCDSTLSKNIFLNDVNPYFQLDYKEVREHNRYLAQVPDSEMALAGYKWYYLDNVSYEEIKQLITKNQKRTLENYTFKLAVTYRNQDIYHDTIAWMIAALEIHAIPPRSTNLVTVSTSSDVILFDKKGDILYTEHNPDFESLSPIRYIPDSLIAYCYKSQSNNNKKKYIYGVRIKNIKQNRLMLDLSRSFFKKGHFIEWIDYQNYLISGIAKNYKLIELIVYNKLDSEIRIITFRDMKKYSNVEVFNNNLQIVRYYSVGEDGEDDVREFKDIDLDLIK